MPLLFSIPSSVGWRPALAQGGTGGERACCPLSCQTGVCRDSANGFGLLWNWNILGDGEHVVRAYVDGVLLDERQVTVTTLGEEFHTDLEGEYVLEDFPYPGESVTIEWQRGQQNFVITNREE